tara:strand:- start:189 stop:461 length:273 start_codon:yes stop_codon:yes gene_type:complete
MFILDNINTKWFLLSFAIGLFLVYCSAPKPEIIIKYPTPDNASHTIFKDDIDNCYKFDVEQVKCPTDKKLINNIPISRKIEYFTKKKNNN